MLWSPLSPTATKALRLKRCTRCGKLRWLSSFYAGLAYCISCPRAYDRTPPGRRRKSSYQKSPKGRQAQETWRSSPGGKVSLAHAQAMRRAREAVAGPMPSRAEVAARVAEFDDGCAYCSGEMSQRCVTPEGLEHVVPLKQCDWLPPRVRAVLNAIGNRVPACSSVWLQQELQSPLDGVDASESAPATAPAVPSTACLSSGCE